MGDIVWADDVAECVSLTDAASAGRHVATAASNFAEAFATFGYTLTFGETKTAAIVKLHGDGSRAARGKLYRPKASLPVLLDSDSPAALPLVSTYKHLGVVQAASMSLLPELRLRCGSAWAAFRQGRKAVYRNRRISLKRRGILLTSGVLTRLFYGAGAWPVLRAGEEQLLTGALMGLMRQTLCVLYDGDQHVCRAETCALLGLADPRTALHVERLRYVRQLAASAPDTLWALIRLDPPLLAAYRGLPMDVSIPAMYCSAA